MTYLTADQILAADDAQHEEVDCPEWGGKVLLKSMSSAERDAYENLSLVDTGKKVKGKPELKFDRENFRARLVAFCAVGDRGGQPIFSVEQIQALGSKNSAALARCFDVAMRLCGMSEADLAELEKNSGDGQHA